MASVTLTTDMLTVFGMLGLVIFLFLVIWIRVNVVAILTMISTKKIPLP